MSLTDDFKQTLSGWASGVSVVTTKRDGMLYGLTVSSFTSLSLTPPLVLVCLHTQNRMPQMILEAGVFAVSILAEDQQDASAYFARPGRVPTADFTVIDGDWTPTGLPIVKGCLGWLSCRLHEQIVKGDHAIVVGEVIETRSRADVGPLVYFRRGYRRVET